MSDNNIEEEKKRQDRIDGLTKQVEMLELRARVLEAKVRIADAQDKLGITPPLKGK